MTKKLPVVTMVLIGRAGIYDAEKNCYYHNDWMNSMRGEKVCVLKDAFLPSNVNCFDSNMKFLGTVNTQRCIKPLLFTQKNAHSLKFKKGILWKSTTSHAGY